VPVVRFRPWPPSVKDLAPLRPAHALLKVREAGGGGVCHGSPEAAQRTEESAPTADAPTGGYRYSHWSVDSILPVLWPNS